LAGHDGFRQQADDRPEADPNQSQIREVLYLVEESLVFHGGAPSRTFCLPQECAKGAFPFYRQEQKCGWKRICRCALASGGWIQPALSNIMQFRASSCSDVVDRFRSPLYVSNEW